MKTKILCFLLLGLALACSAPAGELTEPADELTEPAPLPILTAPDDDLPALACDDEQPPLVTGFNIFQPPHLPEPQARVPFRGPPDGYRIEDDADTAISYTLTAYPNACGAVPQGIPLPTPPKK